MASSVPEHDHDAVPDLPATWPHETELADRAAAHPDDAAPLPDLNPEWLRKDEAEPDDRDPAPEQLRDATPPHQRDAATGAGGVAVALRPPVARARVRPPDSPRQRHRPTRPAGIGMAALLLFTLLSAFFGWVSAEPFWLAVGHSDTGTVLVTRCGGKGLDRHCLGTFTSADGDYRRSGVPILGRAPRMGTEAPARMTSGRGDRAYVGAGTRPRAGLGVGLVLLCGFGIAWATGARRLPTARARAIAILLSFAGPLALFAGLLAITF